MKICDNVNLSVFKTDKFNSISMSVSFVLPALEYTTTGNNLLAGMFFEGCEKYKTPKKIYTILAIYLCLRHRFQPFLKP